MIRMKRKALGLLTAGLLCGSLLTAAPAEAAGAGWNHDSKGWWYTYADGTYAKNKWAKIDGKWYHFNAKGYMDTGWKKIDGKWYYFGTGGVMQTGWKKIDGKWYYFSTGGVMQTGWKKIDGKWYYFAGGVMQTGWKKMSEKWYYFNSNGVVQTGWKKLSGKWYYFDADAVMQTGRQVIGGEPYFFKDNGILDETAYDFSSVKAGDVIRFGVYEQDNDTANGPERIAWKVLEQDGTGVLLISESLLDCKKFHEQEVAVTWETCDLRTWLNKDFLSTAFNSGEQKLILTTKVVTPDNEYYETDCGKDTQDKVYLLSYQEAEKLFPQQEFSATSPIPYTYEGNKDGAAKATEYALQQGVQGASTSEWYSGCGEWWLRTMGADQTYAAYISDCGSLYDGGNGVCNNNVGVRPVIRVRK